MASTTDPRGAGFDAAGFRDAIKFAMAMGQPEDENKRVTFKWTVEKTFSTADPAGNPYRWDTTPSKVVAHEDVQVLCAVQSNRIPNASGTPFGEIDSNKLTLTLLDEQYAEVEGADKVEIDNALYNIDFVAPPVGLFDVTVYTIHLTAEDES